MIQMKIPVQGLPNSPNGKHLVRFRVVSIDENRTSHWIYKEVEGVDNYTALWYNTEHG